jgi:hypothetical protein
MFINLDHYLLYRYRILFSKSMVLNTFKVLFLSNKKTKK